MKIPSILSRIPAAAALFAFRANGSPVAQPVFTDAGFAIAIQCWSFKEFTLFEAIEMAAAAGAGAVEVYPGQPLGGGFDEVKFGPGMAENALQAVIGHLAENHLAAINLGVIEIPHDEAEARKIFEFARKLGLYGITTESLGAIYILENSLRNSTSRSVSTTTRGPPRCGIPTPSGTPCKAVIPISASAPTSATGPPPASIRSP